MKITNRIITLMLAVILISGISGCKKDDDGNLVLDLPSLTMKKDGTDWKSMFRATLKGDIPKIGDCFMITATNGISITNGEYLAIIIRGNEVKKYDLKLKLLSDTLKTECAVIYKDNASDEKSTYTSVEGWVEITSIVTTPLNKISGKFSFKLKNGSGEIINFTEGEFDKILFKDGAISDIFSNDSTE